MSASIIKRFKCHAYCLHEPFTMPFRQSKQGIKKTPLRFNLNASTFQVKRKGV